MKLDIKGRGLHLSATDIIRNMEILPTTFLQDIFFIQHHFSSVF